MIETKLIKKDTDLSNISRMNWDTYWKDTPLYVYRVEGFYHSIVGRWGNNDYWCCRRGEKPTYETLMEFSGHTCNWGISVEENNSHRYKWEEHEIDSYIKIQILRNNKKFYEFVVNDLDYGLAKARVLLTEIHEHPICFGEIDYEKQIIGRKIYFKDIPCIIKRHELGSDRVIIVYDDSVPFFNSKNLEKYFKPEEDYIIVEDIFADSIDWFRGKEYED